MRAEVAIIGGGPAGAASAILLARAGRNVVLLERENHPQHKVCGEFLSHEALAYLAALKMDVHALGAVSVGAVRIGGGSSVPLPFKALSLTRRALDEALLMMAEEAGAKVMRGCTVNALKRAEAGWTSDCAAARVDSRAVFLATGKHNLRGWIRPPGSQNDLVSFKMYWRLTEDQAAALDGHVELLLYRGGYAGLQPVEGGVANLCCLVRKSELRRAGGQWQSFLEAIQEQSPHLAKRLRGAEPLLPRPLTVASIPYGMVRQANAGVWCLGDQAVVIPSFTGDGMSIALHTAALAARMYLAGKTPEAYARSLQKNFGRKCIFLRCCHGRWCPSQKAFGNLLGSGPAPSLP